KRVQPLSRRWVPEPALCMEASPTISSQYLSTTRTSSGSFPPIEVTFHVSRASLSIRPPRSPLGDALASLVRAWPGRVPRGIIRAKTKAKQIQINGIKDTKTK
ncbi:hypothetical protein ILYODFUR_028861, partial [Ilyodon furcidens]